MQNGFPSNKQLLIIYKPLSNENFHIHEHRCNSIERMQKEPQVLTIPVLADVTSVNAYMHGTDAILNLSWTSAGKDALQCSDYNFQDATFASGTSISVPGTKISFTELNLQTSQEIGADDSFNMAARVRCTAEGKAL